MGFAINYSITSIQPLMAESYPTEFRNTGVAWGQAFGRLGAIAAPIIAGLIISLGVGYSISFMFFIVPAIIGVLGVVFFIKRETRGISLDQLAEAHQK